MNKDMNTHIEEEVFEEGNVCASCYCAYTVTADTPYTCPECTGKGYEPDYFDPEENMRIYG